MSTPTTDPTPAVPAPATAPVPSAIDHNVWYQIEDAAQDAFRDIAELPAVWAEFKASGAYPVLVAGAEAAANAVLGPAAGTAINIASAIASVLDGLAAAHPGISTP
jgi:hypothetical protein